jgi:hypothetical protein
LLGLNFKPEDGGNKFLRNVTLCPNYTNYNIEVRTLLILPSLQCNQARAGSEMKL